jgi:hypothetical protein
MACSVLLKRRAYIVLLILISDTSYFSFLFLLCFFFLLLSTFSSLQTFPAPWRYTENTFPFGFVCLPVCLSVCLSVCSLHWSESRIFSAVITKKNTKLRHTKSGTEVDVYLGPLPELWKAPVQVRGPVA